MNSIQYGLFFSLIVTLMVSCTSESKFQEKKQKPPTAVDVIIANNQLVTNTMNVSGSVQANEMVELHPEVNGRLTYLNIPDGAFVSEGTVLARINDADLQAQLHQVKAQLQLVQAQEQRLQELLKVRGVNQAEYDAAANEVLRVRAQMQVIQAQIEKTVVRAPFSGTLGLRLVSPGAYVTPQTKLSTLVQTTPIKIDFQVPEVYASSVAVGTSVSCTAPDKTICSAQIVAVEPYIQTSTRNISVRAVAHKTSLQPGTYVTIALAQTIQGIAIPTNAIIPDANKNQVVLVRNGKASFVNVETGMRTPEFVHITQGLSPGDSVVVSGMLFVRNNQPVQVKQVKSMKK